MKVFKFGGASVKDAEAVRNVGEILKAYTDQKLLVVISAMGKTTNGLEAVLEAYYNKAENTQDLFNKVKKQHFDCLRALFKDEQHPAFAELNDTFVEIDWILEDEPQESYNYLYDQLVSMGEFASTRILSSWLKEIGINHTWLDVRDCIKTDNKYREATVDWVETETEIKKRIPKLLDKGLVLTQGFLGCTSENFTTTLGREGSDYTAAIFAHCLDAEEVNVWKDVPAILTADPKRVPDAKALPQISYYEAIEMTWYGASVIHPKTIKPLFAKGIPLRVRSFVDQGLPGTVINDEETTSLPPILIVKEDQLLISLYTKDFSFFQESNISLAYQMLEKHSMKANLIQNAAVSLSIVVDHKPRRVGNLLTDLEQEFSVLTNSNLELITIRHYDMETVAKYIDNREAVLSQQSRQTIQTLVLRTSFI